MKKKLIVAGAAAALSAAAAVPAFALENEFHGMYKLKYILSNADDGGSGFISPVKSATAANFFEQRARIFYTAKANDDLKLVTGSRFGSEKAMDFLWKFCEKRQERKSRRFAPTRGCC